MKTICTMEFVKMARSSRGVCTCCGRPMVKGEKVARIYTPYQQRGVNIHEGCYAKAVRPLENARDDSNNCKNHTVTISKVADVDVLYFTHYGFKKFNGYLKQEYQNAQSAGVIVAKAIEAGYNVKVDGVKVATVAEYDRMTKTICMR